MCNHRVVNPGISAAHFGEFYSSEDAINPGEVGEDQYTSTMSCTYLHSSSFACFGYVHARQHLEDLFSESGTGYQLLVTFFASPTAILSRKNCKTCMRNLGQEHAPEASLV